MNIEGHSPRSDFKKDGFVHLRGVLTADDVATFTKALDDLADATTAGMVRPRTSKQMIGVLGRHADKTYNILQVIDYTDRFDSLLDNDLVLEQVLDIMGIYIQVGGIDGFIRAPSEDLCGLNRFHTDGGPAIQQYAASGIGRPLQIKAQFFLTEVNEADAGNFMAIPGSHQITPPVIRTNCQITETEIASVVDGGMGAAVQFKVQPGDVVIHHCALWHAVAPNYGNTTRKSVSVRYNPLWSRPYYDQIPSTVLSRLSPRQLRLLGVFGQQIAPTEYYTPAGQEELLRSE